MYVCIYIYICIGSSETKDASCWFAAPKAIGAKDCTPEIDTSEIIGDFQWRFPMDFQRHFPSGCSLVSGKILHTRNHKKSEIRLENAAGNRGKLLQKIIGAKDNPQKITRAKYYTPEITKVKLNWKIPLKIHWNIPENVHRESDYPFGKTADK